MAQIRLLFQYREEFYHPKEIEMRGYLNAVVEIDGDKYYEVVFHTFELVDLLRRNGGYCFSEPGMILVSELTKEILIASVNELYKGGFFYGLKEYPADQFKDYKEADF